MEAGRSCPRCCGAAALPESSTKCPRCAGIWVSQDVLLGCIRAFLEQEGEDSRIVPLLESPAGAGKWTCMNCSRPMVRIKLRGVSVDRCDDCRFLFLETGAVALISRRVLASARSPKRTLPLTRSKLLESILTNRSLRPR